MRRRRILAGAAGLTVGSLGGCLEPLAGASRDYDVGMSANAFDPRELHVTVGTTVVWENDGSRAHTVTAYDDRIPEEASYFASGGYPDQATAYEAWHTYNGGNLYTGEQFSHTFTVPGRYEYYCIPHERGDMRGVVLVDD